MIIIIIIIELPMCNSAKCKKKFTGHYGTVSHRMCQHSLPKSSQANKLAFIYMLLQPLPVHCLCSNIRPQTRVHVHLSVNAPNNVTTSSTKMHRYGIPQPI